MRVIAGLPLLGHNPILQARLLPLTVRRCASRLSGIHQGLRREIRQPPQEEPYLSPEERQRARAIARRNPVEYKIRKGKKDITEEPGPPRKSRAARFNDPRDPYGADSIVKKFKTGKLLQEARDKLNSRSGGIMSPKDFELQMKLQEAENFMAEAGPARRQHERPGKFAARMEKRAPSRRSQNEQIDDFENAPTNSFQSRRSKDDHIDDFENAPRNSYQSRNRERNDRASPAPFEAKDDRSNQFGSGFLSKARDFDTTRDDLKRPTSLGAREGRFESAPLESKDQFGSGFLSKARDFDTTRDDSKRPTSFGSREGRFESPARSQRYQDAPRNEARSYRSEDNDREPERRRSTFREEGNKDRFEESDEADDEFADADGTNPQVRRLNVWEPPVVVPYTTAASQFLYGTSTVEAAIRANRRQLYKLYIYKGNNRRNKEKDDELADMAQRRRIKIEYMDETGLTMLNRMTNSRAHNGYVLEASPLPQTPVQALGEVPEDAGRPGFNITLGYQSREERAINGTPDFIMTEPSTCKPFVLLLDQILDPGNLGAVIRTASFMGVTAIVVSKRGSAPVTPTVLKASAGAAETMTIMSTESVVDFVTASREKGWKVYAAVPPKGDAGAKRQVDTYDVESNDPLLEDPCVLALGNEGEGLSRQLTRAADVQVSIPNMGGSKVVDSLNVSVAAGLLCQAFLRGKTTASMVHATEAKSKNSDILF